MSTLTKFLTIGAVLVVSACSNGGLFGGRDALSSAGTAGAVVPGSVSDPTSPAYFNQTIGDRVLFAVDQSTLSPQAQTVLDGQAQWLLTNTDEQGTREYNLALGARRANAAREYLISRGVAGNRLQVISYGKERPIEICSEEACYQQNRRAVTVLSSALTG